MALRLHRGGAPPSRSVEYIRTYRWGAKVREERQACKTACPSNSCMWCRDAPIPKVRIRGGWDGQAVPFLLLCS